MTIKQEIEENLIKKIRKIIINKKYVIYCKSDFNTFKHDILKEIDTLLYKKKK